MSKEAQQDHLLIRQVEMLYSSAAPALMSGVCVAIVIAITSYLVESGLHSFYWMSAVLAITAARALLTDRYWKDTERQSDATYWERCFLMGTVGSGLVWGLAPWLIFPDQSLILKFFLYTILTAMAAVSISLYSYRFRVYASFCIPLFALVAIDSYRYGELMMIFSGLIVVVCGVLLRISWQYQCSAVGMLQGDAENAVLTARVDSLNDKNKVIKDREIKAVATLEEAGILSWSCDDKLNLTHLSRRFKETTGVSLSEIVGHSMNGLNGYIVEESPGLDAFTFALHNRESFRELDLHFDCINGAKLLLQFSGKPVFDEANEFSGFEGYARDVTANLTIIEDLRYQAKHDLLTGLINRDELLLRISPFVPPVNLKGKVPHVVYLDVHRLKVVNDNLGLAAGDEMFRHLAGILSDTVGQHGVCARLGGSAFGILLAPGELAEALKITEASLKAIDSFRLKKESLSFSVSARAGVVGITPQMESAQDVVDRADLACRNADSSGNKRFCLYHEELLAKVHVSGSESLARILSELEQDKLSLRYQPIVELESGKVAWYEGLLSKVDDAGKVVLLGAQLASAEKHGVISRFDEWAVNAALADLKQHPHLVSCGVSVNVSSASICNRRFIESVLQSLKRQEIPASRLSLEITETNGVADLEQARNNLSTLARRGCKLILDDFGTGCSSLEYLKYLPISSLKINHTFLSSTNLSEIDQIICQSIVDLGRKTGCVVIAESVEDAAMIEVIRKLGIHYAQGYALGKPALLPQPDMPIAKVG